MIGLLVAVDEELLAVRKLIEKEEKIIFDNDIYYQGFIADKEVILSKAGIGKVNCAYLTTKMLMRFKPQLMINIGVAGSLDSNLEIFNTIIATSVAQHDMHVAGWPKGFKEDRTLVKIDDSLLKDLKKIKFTYPLIFGPIVSGDVFVEKKHIADILRFYPEALAVEMEGAALAWVCERCHVKWLVIRSISDLSNKQNNDLTYEQFVKEASERATTFLVELLRSYYA